ncbi:MAG: hypothetical protein Q8L75_06895 [Acidobacteriota bacterium]|nr:hypothetical protein [Acidobacteriota bacterium]
MTPRGRSARLSSAVLTVFVLGSALAACASSTPATPEAYRAPRTPEGTPDLNGIWQANNTANWNIEAHTAKQGPVFALGAAFSVPPGMGVVDGDEIPYLPEALAKRDANGANWTTLDPEVKCFMPGIPRATYLPYPFQIVQSADNILFTYEYASASRIVRMNSQEKSPAPAWMGWNLGRWDGESLVIDVTDQMEETWFDRAGNYHSDALKVTERYTAIDANTLQYEATIEDPKVFSRPWKMSMPLYRRREPNARLMEYKCVEFAEELMYGHLRKK